MKQPVDYSTMNVDEIVKAKMSLQVELKKAEQAERDLLHKHQLVITSNSVRELLERTTTDLKKDRLYSQRILRLGLLLFYVSNKEILKKDLWTADDYNTLRNFCNLAIMSNLTGSFVGEMHR